MDRSKRIRILTVGDGDLSLSLAIARAYGKKNDDDDDHADGDEISLTASILDCDEKELLSSFSDAPLKELVQRKVPILYGIDATQLHRIFQNDEEQKWDMIIFHHPHLGLASLDQDEGEHANRHHQLLCHYLYSASQVSKLVHVCLCGTQRTTWDLDGASQRQGLKLIQELSTTVPFSQLWTTSYSENIVHDDDNNRMIPMTARIPLPEYAAPRKYRYGKLGSRHFLGKFGYRHRRTTGERYRGTATDMNVTGSMHYIFEVAATVQDDDRPLRTGSSESETISTNSHSCSICGRCFTTLSELEDHLSAPALPQGAEFSNSTSRSQIANTTTVHFDDNQKNGSQETSNHTSPPPTVSACADRPRGPIESEWIVPVEDDGRRLRWFLKKTNLILSKSQANEAVRSGRVWVDGTPAHDTSRILKVGMSVILYAAVLEASRNSPLESKDPNSIPTTTIVVGDSMITVVSRQEPFLIVEKPSGMRTKGAIPGSLEFILSRQEGVVYECLSRLDTSTSGLCALIPRTVYSCLQTLPEITHSMVALIHGQVPDTWSPHFFYEFTTASVPLRKWKKRKHTVDDSSESGLGSSSSLHVAASSSMGNGVTIFPLERSNISMSGLSLSTVRIETQFPSAASLCHIMRTLGYPVVGDTHCRREYLGLKRSIRNRIKNRICLASHQVVIRYSTTDDDHEETRNNVTIPSIPPPIANKLSAVYWDTHFGDGEGDIQTAP